MRLEVLHPEVAGRDCSLCQLYVHDEATGAIVRQPSGQPVERTAVNLPPCETATGCYKGTPENQLDLSAKNRQAWQHFLGCRQIGRFPPDSIVERNAEVIANALWGAERDQCRIAEHRSELASARIQAALLQAAVMSRSGGGP